MAYVYMVRCSDGTFYTGCAKDLLARLEAHNRSRGAKYTAGRVPVALAYSEECDSMGAALRREHEIKRLTRAQKQKLAQSGSSGRLR
jgi:predicted GIY-YIG superfamily endonuclease